MLRNYFLIAWRNIIKNPYYSMLNISGLSAGIAFTMLVAAYIWNEMRVNDDLKHANNQYVIQSKWKDPNFGYTLGTVGPLAKALCDNHPDLVANYYRFDGVSSFVSKGDKIFREGLQIGDSTLLSMYGFELMYGNLNTVFSGPYSTVISKDKAIKYFGKPDVVGQTLTIENFSGSKHEFQITGVLKDMNRNSVSRLIEDYPSDIFISIQDLAFFGRNMDWNNFSIPGYVELQPGVEPEQLVKPIQYLVKQNTPQRVSEDLTPYLVPLKEYYLSANGGLVAKMLKTLGLIAAFILLMAIINFVNMALSRSTIRMREIGIRKVLGGIKRQLFVQFLAESTLLVFFAASVAAFIYQLLRQPMGRILNADIPALFNFPIYFILFPIVLILVVGFAAGIYPAFVLSTLPSVQALKNKLATVKENVLLRKFLIAIQFGTATMVIIAALVISQQIQLFFSHQLGYDKEYIVSAQVPRDWTPTGVKHMEYVRSQFASLPAIKDISLSYEIPDGNNSGSMAVYREGADSATAVISQMLMTDDHYSSTYNIPMAAGEFYHPKGFKADSTRLVINETQSKAMGWSKPENAIGQRVLIQGGNQLFTIAGVIKDFHFGSMQNAIPPLVFLQLGLTNTFRYLSFKVKPGNINQTITEIQQQWAALMPGTSFEFKFLDETLNKVYKKEIQLKRATYMATFFSLLIALLGILGLVSLSIHKKTKEIGIRKVLGASMPGIIQLFIKEFLPVILLAGFVACPLAWYLLQQWLSRYAYRITISVAPFLFSIAGLAIITIVLIILQTIKTSLQNPVTSLKNE